MSETSRTTAEEEDDASVIERSRREPEAFAEVFRRHAPDIKRYVTRRLGADAAEDVVAETFLAAFRQRERYDLARPSAPPWLYGIATNLIGRHKRIEVRQLRILSRAGTDPVSDSFTDRSDERLSAQAGRRPRSGGRCVEGAHPSANATCDSHSITCSNLSGLTDIPQAHQRQRTRTPQPPSQSDREYSADTPGTSE